MWKNFEGKARTREESLERIRSLQWTGWKPEGITLHNTAAPTLAQWAETGPNHAARIRNLQHYYENQLGWHSGPHFFVSRDWINWFSDPLSRGVHSRCYNATRFGIEMVGDFAREPFNSGDGAKVRDNAIFLIAALNNKFGWRAEDIVFHKDCKLDNHDCPGKFVVKSDVIARVKAEMARQKGLPAPVIPDKEDGPKDPPPKWKAPDHDAFKEDDVLGIIHFQVTGKMSHFGGPNDKGVKPNEGLGPWPNEKMMRDHGVGDYLLTPKQAGAPGLARRLNPAKFYVACRWNVKDYPFLRKAWVILENPKNGKKIKARVMDWGPAAWTGRVADLSPGACDALGLKTDDIVKVTVYKDGSPETKPKPTMKEVAIQAGGAVVAVSIWAWFWESSLTIPILMVLGLVAVGGASYWWHKRK